MKFTLLVLAALSVVSLAHYTAVEVESIDVVYGDMLEPRRNKNKTHTHDHAEHGVPDFRTKCVCPEAKCDPRMNAQSICACKASARQACYLATNGGCEMPKLKAC